jgi:hypothetical protein
MKQLVATMFACAIALHMSSVLADEARVTWRNASCGYFVVKLPEDSEAEKFGLFSIRALPLPDVGDELKGSMTSIETQLENLTSGEIHNVIHWADAKTQEQLVQKTTRKCGSKPGNDH